MIFAFGPLQARFTKRGGQVLSRAQGTRRTGQSAPALIRGDEGDVGAQVIGRDGRRQLAHGVQSLGRDLLPLVLGITRRGQGDQ